MIPPQTLGALSTAHELLTRLVEGVPDTDLNRRFHPDLEPLGWLLGRAVYLETYWLREVVAGDHDLTDRVRPLFAHDAAPPVDGDPRLPPKDHLLNWALEIQDTHLTRLANPRLLPEHPLLTSGWLPAYLLQAHGRIYERMLAVLSARALQQPSGYRVREPLVPRLPVADTWEITQGTYRIGAREGVVFDNELPAQAVELGSFRIARQPVRNAEYLAFLVDDGYGNDAWWDPVGLAWRNTAGVAHPWHWRRDPQGRWFGVGLSGPADLSADDPVMGLNRHEAQAYARWAATRGEGMAGAIVQHEYQWETAARTGAISGYGRAWEWCANPFAAYDQYQPPADPELASRGFDGTQGSLRGGCLHTQPRLRRSSLRHWGPPDAQYLFAGTRLVMPPG